VRLLAKGRAADVYDLGDGTVLRRYREGTDTGHEAAMMQQVARAGFPVPAVQRADGADLVMDRVDGPTMLADLSRAPWRLWRHADLLAELMQRLHQIPVVGGQVLHIDLHPGNVILSKDGPVVIDWTGARIGPWAWDVGMTWLIVATSVPDGSPWDRRLAATGQGLFARRFLSHFDLAPVRQVLPDLARERIADHHVTPIEAARVSRLAGI
jgi:aminoglycoside phosphotransferase (APT) family kinase protein